MWVGILKSIFLEITSKAETVRHCVVLHMLSYVDSVETGSVSFPHPFSALCSLQDASPYIHLSLAECLRSSLALLLLAEAGVGWADSSEGILGA